MAAEEGTETHPSPGSRRWVWAVAVLLAVALGTALAWPHLPFTGDEEEAQGPRAIPVVAEAAWRGTAETRFHGIAVVDAEEGVDIAAAETGRIAELTVADGDSVASGELLVRLDSSQQEARLRAAELALAKAERDLERDRVLAADGHIAPARLEQTGLEKERAEAELEAAREALERRRITAPHDGRISLSDIAVGDVVSPGQRIMQLVAPDLRALRVDLPTSVAERVALGDPATVAPDGSAWPARVIRREARAETMTGTVRITVQVQSGSGGLIDGAVIPVSIVLEERPDAVLVSPKAIQLAGPEHYVFTLDEQDTATRTPVQIGMRRPDAVEITRGLEAGMRVVTEGAAKIGDGDRVKPRAPGSGNGRPSEAEGV